VTFTASTPTSAKLSSLKNIEQLYIQLCYCAIEYINLEAVTGSK